MVFFDSDSFRIPLQSTPEERDEEIEKYIKTNMDLFPEWYQPVRLGKNSILTRTFPNFKSNPDSLILKLF